MKNNRFSYDRTMWDLNEADHNPVTVVYKVNLAKNISQVVRTGSSKLFMMTIYPLILQNVVIT